MERYLQCMMQMLRHELTGEPFPKDLAAELSEADWNRILSVSKRHDVAHLLGDLIAREELSVPSAVKNAFDEIFCEAVLRAQLFEGELKRLSSVFQKAEIPFVPLKGAVIRRLYPEPWMRTSCDIDILIHPEDTKRAKALLMNNLGYRFEKHAYHELSMYSPSGVHLELHFTIEEHTETLDRVLKNSWNYAEPLKEGSFCYRFQNAFLVFYSVAHAAYHFKGGGCGIRPFIDQLLLEQKVDYDRAVYQSLIREAKLEPFEEQFLRLTRIWFSNEEHNDLTRRMEDYILSANIYGSLENRETVRLLKRGRWGNLWFRIWLPYRELVTKYPSLKGKRVLQLFYEIRRWFSIFKRGKMKKIRKEIKTNLAVEKSKAEQISNLLNDLHLPI